MTAGAIDAWATDRPQRFFIVIALVALAVALTGFAGTFFLPVAQGRFAAPPIVFVHGGLAFAWVLMFVIQPSLIALGRYDIHARTGLLGLLIALALALSGPFVGLVQVERELAAGLGPTAVSGLVGVFTSLGIFLGLVVAAVALRGRPDFHKRLMLLATIVVLWPAWFRFRHYFPDVPRPDIWFGVVAPDCLMLAAALRDRLVHGRVHPVWLWVAPPIVAEQFAEVLLFDSAPWRAVAQALYAWLG